MLGFVAGWCRVEDATSFAQAFHRAASRMGRACAQIAQHGSAGTTGPAAQLTASWDAVDDMEPVGILPAIDATHDVENEE